MVSGNRIGIGGRTGTDEANLLHDIRDLLTEIRDLLVEQREEAAMPPALRGLRGLFAQREQDK